MSRNEASTQKTYALNAEWLIGQFQEYGWKDHSFGGRLARAYAGKGEFCLHGLRGDDNELLRYHYVETKVTPGYDHQVSMVTQSGEAAYLIFSLLFPRNALAQAA